MKRFVCFALLMIFLTACAQEETPVRPATAVTTTVETMETAVAAPAQPTPTLKPPPSPTPIPPAADTPTPTAVPTAPPTAVIGADSGIPLPLIETARQLTTGLPDQFSWGGAEPDAQISFGEGEPLAVWTYAVAAPFYTIPDDIAWQELQSAWQSGALILDAETEATLRALWGAPTQTAVIVPEEELVDALWNAQESFDQPALTVLPFDRLEPKLKVLSVDGASPIAVDFDPDAYPLTVPISVAGDEETAVALLSLWTGPTTNRDETLITHIAMTGPGGMRRAVADRMETYGLTYPAEETGPILQAADIAHMSNEDPFAVDCPLPDPNDSETVCNRDDYFPLIEWMGIDVMEMTGNHLNDWHRGSLDHTIDLYESIGLGTFGGGRNLEAARQPLLMEHNGNKIAFVGCNPIGPDKAWATADTPGALPCGDYSYIVSQIEELNEAGYTVIATLQYLEHYQYTVWPQQRHDFDQLAAAGAAIVSGSQGHHPQAFNFVEDGFVHYGIGNLLADQMWSLETRQMFINRFVVYDGRLLTVNLWTGLNENYARVRAMTPQERADLLTNVFEASQAE